MLVDDHYLVRVGLANVLGLEPDIEVCADAERGDEALALLEELGPGDGRIGGVSSSQQRVSSGRDRCLRRSLAEPDRSPAAFDSSSASL
jgi:hypothetical protein